MDLKVSPQEIKVKSSESQSIDHDCTSSLRELIEKVKSEPPKKFVYRGIKEGTIGLIVGPAKSGKTTFCENLALTIASGGASFLGLPIDINNKKVMFLSFEEDYSLRTPRNELQIARLIKEKGTDWLENYRAANEQLPLDITTEAQWSEITAIIKKHGPGLVIIDSLTHLYSGEIENSAVAKKVMARLKDLKNNTGTTILIIHHLVKLNGSELSMDSIAGSRVVAGEVDFAIGLNCTSVGKRYIKDIFNRYARENKGTVTTFDIDEESWLYVTGTKPEWQVLQCNDGRKDDTNKDKVFECMKSHATDKDNTISAAPLIKELVESKVMARPTMFKCIDKLIEEKQIIKVSHNTYKIAC